MTLFDYNKNSILNTPLARILNAIIVVPLLAILSVSSFSLEVDATCLIPVFYIVFSVGGGIGVILNRNKWQEFDKKETERKKSFVFSYCVLSFIFAFAIGLLILKAIESYNSGGLYYIYLSTIAYLIFNQVNICSLFNFGDYFEELFSLYDCKDKDAEKNVVKYVLRRDYNIDIDELYYEIRRLKGLDK